ncbi:ATP-dependent nuclease [Psychromarinibacter sp. S121]|uniref:ATP-dependent nuclease n=1 Tax=Psychromarinibacter sp. S121 TaxID=3415127 RepID=UPI003C7D5EC0
MQLTSFTVSNFRSITTAKKVPLTNYSVLVGANNEGKSNILHALALGMQVIEGFKHLVVRDRLGRIISTRSTPLGSRTRHNWSHDFPISKQVRSSKDQCIEISFEFKLSDAEVESFHTEIGSKLNGTLPVLVRLSRDDQEVLIPKQGRGGAVLNKKANRIADFVSRNVRFEYIPAIRTSESAEDVILNLLSKELDRLEENPEYKDALRKIDEIQEPVLRDLSESMTATISSFLPSVDSVEIKMHRDARTRAMRRGLQIEVDDGNKTLLERKGDGVKSLVALALMRYASNAASGSASSIVAIEEPEAHLHPQAIHELRDVLTSLSDNNQVILTSHSPLFVNPALLDSTIVVQESKAAVAKNIAEVREVLGVRLSDNLQSARLVAIVEGDDDVIVLKAILQRRYPALEAAIKNGDLVFDALGGASNLSYKVRTYRSSATLVQCFLDSDAAGVSGVQKALSDAIIREADYNLINVPGQKEAELEDLLDAKKYKDAFFDHFEVDPTVSPPAAKGQKWSVAMEKKFQVHGKIWDDGVEMRVKLWLAEFAKDNVGNIVIEARSGPVDAFARSLLKKLQIDS